MNNRKGFSLLEVLLVLAIASSLIVLMLNYTTQRSDELRRDKTVLQMQQILNAGMSYYLNQSRWPLPSTITCGVTPWPNLTASALPPYYIPKTLLNNPYANSYNINCNTAAAGGGFFVYTTANSAANAAVIAGRLPLAFITTPGSINAAPPITQPPECRTAPFTGCTVVVASVNIPGQNLNNARSVNFAGVYYSGSCVPAPNCPPGMKPNIIVAPTSVSGINDPPKCDTNEAPFNITGCRGNVNPVSSFTAFARGDKNGSPIDPNTPGPLDCKIPKASVEQAVPKQCWQTDQIPFPADEKTLYWRVCLTVTTDRGVVYPTVQNGSFPAQHGKMMGSIIAITRCVPNKGIENPSGSINVWQQNSDSKP